MASTVLSPDSFCRASIPIRCSGRCMCKCRLSNFRLSNFRLNKCRLNKCRSNKCRSNKCRHSKCRHSIMYSNSVQK